MITPLTLAFLAVTVLATSFLSGVFGMAGGMILLGVLLLYMDVAPAMVLLGVIQTASNLSRMVFWREHVLWNIVFPFIAGALACFAVMRLVSFVPSKPILYLCLGLTPILVDNLPKRLSIDITRPRMPYFCGAIIMFLQFVAGVAGSVLDLFFQKSQLNRMAIVGTKAATQVVGHVLRIAYFGSFTAAFSVGLPLWSYAVAVALAIAGTGLATLVLKRMTDADFRTWSRWLIYAVSSSYIIRAVWLMWQG
jgi:uncharacterized membrane protein YfcA